MASYETLIQSASLGFLRIMNCSPELCCAVTYPHGICHIPKKKNGCLSNTMHCHSMPGLAKHVFLMHQKNWPQRSSHVKPNHIQIFSCRRLGSGHWNLGILVDLCLWRGRGNSFLDAKDLRCFDLLSQVLTVCCVAHKFYFLLSIAKANQFGGRQQGHVLWLGC